MPADEVRALTFFALILSIMGLILVNRSFSASVLTALRRPNPALFWIVPTVVAMLALTLGWPLAKELFRFGPLHPDDLAVTVGAGALRFRLSRSVQTIAPQEGASSLIPVKMRAAANQSAASRRRIS